MYQNAWDNMQLYVWVFWGLQIFYRMYILHLIYGYYRRLERGEMLLTENSPWMLDRTLKSMRTQQEHMRSQLKRKSPKRRRKTHDAKYQRQPNDSEQVENRV